MVKPNEDRNRARPIKVRDVEGFIPMLLAACGDAAMKAQLETIVNLPSDEREVGLRQLLNHLRERRAPPYLRDALTCLLDDEIARNVKEALRRCV